MRKNFNSLYWKISGIFLVLLLVLGVVQLMVSLRASLDFVGETDQKLNRRLAGDLAERFSPFLKDSLDYAAIEHTFHELMVMNPRVEIYLIDDSGNLQAYFAEPEKIKRTSVNIDPIRQFLADDSRASLLICGDDPRSLDRQKPFSATPVLIGGRQPGYLYVILGGEQYDSASAMVRGSYIMRTSATVLGGTFVFTGIAGLILFFLLTKRLRAMTSSVQRFDRGDYEQRIDVRSNDEIGQLGRAFNHMADTIVANVVKLRKTDSLRRELIANVSHDLRSPLASIQGYLETILMKESTLSPEKRRHFLNTIYRNVTMLGKLVAELFELSKLDAKQVRPEPEPFAIAELAQDTVLKFQPRAETDHIRLRSSLPQDLPFVYGDIGMIERALSNLIENALRYTPAQGEVAVELAQKQDKIQIHVSDTGQGIPDGDLPHIFDRFYRVERSRSRSSGGTGLGLAISQKIVEAHNSKISVQSAVGAGTTFTFDLAVYQS